MEFSAISSLALADDIRDLFEMLDKPSHDVFCSMAALRGNLKLVVGSSPGFSLRLGGSHPVTLTSVDCHVRSGDIATSLALPLSWTGPDETRSSIVFYAGIPGALVDLSADLAFALGLPLDCLRLDEHLRPDLLKSGIVGLAEMSTVNRAIGTLIGRGYTPQAAQAELGRRAAETGQTVHSMATTLLSTVSNDQLGYVSVTE